MRMISRLFANGTFKILELLLKTVGRKFFQLTMAIQTLYGIDMSTVTFNLSFQDTLIGEVDALARRESRSRSDLLREAARLYIQRQKRWESLFSLGDSVVREADLSPDDVAHEIRAVRKAKGMKTPG